MKANQFVKQDDEAVSPVIAVILMVAITVVLAATVYVWVSGFGTSGSIKKFPQVTLRDDSTDSVASGASATAFEDDDALAVLEHRGGDTINWADYTVTVTDNTGTAGTANFDTLQACTDTATQMATLTGAFAVAGKIYICATSADWANSDEMKVQIVDKNQHSIVYENTVVVS